MTDDFIVTMGGKDFVVPADNYKSQNKSGGAVDNCSTAFMALDINTS